MVTNSISKKDCHFFSIIIQLSKYFFTVLTDPKADDFSDDDSDNPYEEIPEVHEIEGKLCLIQKYYCRTPTKCCENILNFSVINLQNYFF